MARRKAVISLFQPRRRPLGPYLCHGHFLGRPDRRAQKKGHPDHERLSRLKKHQRDENSPPNPILVSKFGQELTRQREQFLLRFGQFCLSQLRYMGH